MDLPRLLSFLDLIHRFQRIDRRVMRPGEERLENDAEHSYQLAMTAWYLNEKDDLGMDPGKLVAYALAHDLVEVYAGDTFAYTTDVDERASRIHGKLLHLSRSQLSFLNFLISLQRFVPMRNAPMRNHSLFMHSISSCRRWGYISIKDARGNARTYLSR